MRIAVEWGLAPLYYGPAPRSAVHLESREPRWAGSLAWDLGVFFFFRENFPGEEFLLRGISWIPRRDIPSELCGIDNLIFRMQELENCAVSRANGFRIHWGYRVLGGEFEILRGFLAEFDEHRGVFYFSSFS